MVLEQWIANYRPIFASAADALSKQSRLRKNNWDYFFMIHDSNMHGALARNLATVGRVNFQTRQSSWCQDCNHEE